MRNEKRTMFRALLLASVLLSLLCSAHAQTGATTASNDAEGGETKDGYLIHQSIEFGGHIVDFSGNPGMWDTFVNLDSGPRLLSQSLDMHSVDHSNLLFDELHETSYGYGGDPNNWTKLRLSKARIYDFSASFRRDRNYFDYDLLANPLNPSTSVPNIPVETSPHRFETVRRMTDINLTLAPQSMVRVRLDYSRNVTEGPSFSSVHEGTEALLFQAWRNGLDTYHAGVDFRVLPRTTFSYDQFVSAYKGDTADTLNATPFNLAGPIPVDLGLPFNTLANQPCAVPILGSGFANPACNGYFGYTRFSPTRNLYPTEQFSFQSNYWKKIDLTGRVTYTGADSDVAISDEFFDGLATRTRTRQLLTTGPVSARRISASADFGFTWHITDKLSFVDDYRWSDFRSPGRYAIFQSALFGPTLASNPNPFTPATCPPPFTAATCPQHNSSSGPDLTVGFYSRYLSQNIQLNTAELEYQFNRRYRVYAGYRFRHRDIDARQFDELVETFFPGPTAALANRGACAGIPLNPDGSCTALLFNGDVVPDFTGLTPDADHIPINEHSLLFGFSLRPWDPFSITYDMELMYADNAFVRIDPRQLQQYRVRALYKPTRWMNFNAAINIRENRNNTLDIGNLQHSRYYNLGAVFMPYDNFSADVNWSYSDIFSQTNICFVATPVPPNSLDCGAPFLTGLSVYDQTAHFLSANLMWKPVKRVTTELGYTGTFANGDTLLLNPNAPLGPLTYNYHLPSAGVRIELAPRWTLSGGWNYYGYNEKGDSGPTLPRDFRGNVATTSIRYAF